MKTVKLVSAQSDICGFWVLQRALSFGFSIEEVLVCGVRSCSGNFVLRNENIFTIQLTADIEFSEGRRKFQVVKSNPVQIWVKCSERKDC